MNKISKIGLTLMFLFGSAINLSAQTVPEPVNQYLLEIFAPGVNTTSGSPVVSSTIPNQSGSITCNLAPVGPTPPPVDNPSKARVDDPLNAGKQCEFVIGAVVNGLTPAANYLATLTAQGATMTSARSAASNPFNRKVVTAPAVPTGLIVKP